MIEIENLSIAFKKRVIFENISFSVARSEVISINGRNGSGKTTLLRCLTGRYKNYQGTIFIDGISADPSNISKFKRLLNFYIDPNYTYDHLTVAENLRTYQYYYQVAALDPELEQLMDNFGIPDLLNYRVSRISAGSFRKMEIVIALMTDAEYVLLDEPTVNLDQRAIDGLYNYIHTMRAKGVSFVMVSHNDPLLQGLADRSINLDAL